MAKGKFLIQRMYGISMLKIEKKIKEHIFVLLDEYLSLILTGSNPLMSPKEKIIAAVEVFMEEQKCRFLTRNKGYKEKYINQQVNQTPEDVDVCFDIIEILGSSKIRGIFLLYLDQQDKNISINKLLASFLILLERCCDIWIEQEIECLGIKDLKDKHVIWEKYKKKPIWPHGIVTQTVKNRENLIEK